MEDENKISSYQYIIKEVLDFRRWFEFKLMYTTPRQNKKELTDNAFFRLSGGEKAMAMYIPLFAAVNARYNGAGKKDCPRIIALDEAFAGKTFAQDDKTYYKNWQPEGTITVSEAAEFVKKVSSYAAGVSVHGDFI